MAAISINTIAQAIYQASKEHQNAEQPEFLKKTVQFLAKKRLLSKTPDILSRLSTIINETEGNIVAKVYSAEKLSEVNKKQIILSLEKRYTGKTVILEENLNEKLIGGYKIEIKDEVIDLSIKNRMTKLQEYLIKSS